MYAGYRASPDKAEWLLFVDAETRHVPEMLASVLQEALEQRADLLSLVIDVEMDTFWERVIVPQLGELYTLLVGTMDQVNKRAGRVAAANGQVMLVRRDLFGEFGKLEGVRGSVVEDRALARTLKERGYNVRLQYGRKLVSARVYSSLGDMWNGYTKTLFWASGNSVPRVLGVVLALSVYALTPVMTLGRALLCADRARRRRLIAHAIMQVAPMLALRAAVCRLMGMPGVYALTYPLAVVVGNAMLLYSMYRVMSGKGVEWKGRVY
jgi:chlorobactene glucosyltransferase